MSTRILGLFCLLITVLLITGSAEAQQPKVPRVGYLSASVRAYHEFRFEAFKQGLREFGYVEGQNIAIEARFAEGKPERVPELAAELVGLNVNVILAGGPQAIRAAKEATKTIPIVMAHSDDPVAMGLVASLARPGGNVTGLTDMSEDLSGKGLEVLKETVPKIRRVAVFLNPTNPNNALVFKETEVVAQGLGVKLQRVEIRRADNLDRAFAAVTRDRAHALIPIADPLINAQRKPIIEFAIKNRLPTMHHSRANVEAGALMYYGPNELDLFRRAATYVDKILRGSKPGDLPVERPTKFEFVVNLKTAKQIGLTIPQSMVYRADRVIR